MVRLYPGMVEEAPPLSSEKRMADLLYRSGSSHLYSGAETHVGGGKDCPFDAGV